MHAAVDGRPSAPGYDPEATLSVSPEENRRLLAQAFTDVNDDEETTLRIPSPFLPRGVPSPIGEPFPEEAPTRPQPMPLAPRTSVLAGTQTFVIAAWSLALALAGVAAFIAIRS